MATIKVKRGASDTTGTLASGEPAFNTSSKKLWMGYDDTNKVWVGAEIEATMASTTSALKLTTQKGIVDYIAGLGYGTGSGDMVLNTIQTVTAAKTFNSGTLKYAGSTSGTTILNATAVAGTTTLVLPAADDTLVGKATTDTLTNKTLTTPKIAQINDTNGLAVLKTGTTASAVNEVTITNNITAQAPHVSATGSDTNISLHLAPKGTGKYVVVENGTDGTKQLAFGVAGATTATTTYLNAAQTADRTITLPDATDTLVGKATTDTLTNKTFNTAGTGNSFSINGTAITAVAGTGAVVLANTPTLITPNIGAATGTSLVLSGDLTVNGTTTTINSTTLTVDDKNIELGSVAVPSDVTADGGGITLKGATDKTLNWVDATDSWTSSEHFNLLTGKAYYINGTSVLNATTLGSAVVSSSLTSVGTIATGTWQGTAIADTYISSAATWNTASTDRLKWDGGATGLVAATGRTSLGLDIGTNVQAWDADLDAVAGGTYTGDDSITTLGTVTTGTIDGGTY